MTDRESKTPFGNRADHPDEMLLAAFADGNLEPSQRRQLEAHLADCEICLGTVTMLAQISDQAATIEPPEALRLKASGAARSWNLTDWQKRSLAAAATLFIVLSVGFIWTSRTDQGEAGRSHKVAPGEARVLRGPVPQIAGPTVLSPQAGQVLMAGSIEVRWSEVAGASDYSVHLLTADGDPVWQDRVAKTYLSVPDSVPLSLGETYFVSVRAHLVEARTLDSSHVEFQVGHRH